MKTIHTIFYLALSVWFMSCTATPTQEENPNHTIAVTVAKATADVTTQSLSVSGKLQAAQQAILSTRIMGFITQLHVAVGDSVAKGTTLLQIQNSDLEAKLAQVEATISEATVAVGSAQKDFERFTSLFKSQSATQKELDDMTARYQMAKARLEAARQMKKEVETQFAYTHIKAPFNGVITRTQVSQGDMARPGAPLLAIEAPQQLEVLASVDASSINSLAKGTKVMVVINSIKAQLEGVVSEISASALHTGGQYEVVVRLPKASPALKSGMYATVEIPVKNTTSTAGIFIQKEALITKGQLTGIYTLSQQNTALLRWVRLGKTIGNQVEVLSGIASGEKYIITSQGKLFNGASVRVQ